MPVMIEICPDDGEPFEFGQPCPNAFWFPIEQLEQVPNMPDFPSSGGSAPSVELTPEEISQINSAVLLLFATAFVFRKLFDFVWRSLASRNDA